MNNNKKFMDYYTDALKKYVVFGGRATRREYWMFTLINILVSIAVGIVAGMTRIDALRGAVFARGVSPKSLNCVSSST